MSTWPDSLLDSALPYSTWPRPSAFAAKLAARPDAERMRLRVGTTFVAHADDLWPKGDAPEPDWIREHALDILDLLPLRNDGQDARRLPHRLHWLLWMLDEIDQGHSNG